MCAEGAYVNCTAPAGQSIGCEHGVRRSCTPEQAEFRGGSIYLTQKAHLDQAGLRRQDDLWYAVLSSNAEEPSCTCRGGSEAAGLKQKNEVHCQSGMKDTHNLANEMSSDPNTPEVLLASKTRSSLLSLSASEWLLHADAIG
jgi:hypothetical protein